MKSKKLAICDQFYKNVLQRNLESITGTEHKHPRIDFSINALVTSGRGIKLHFGIDIDIPDGYYSKQTLSQ